MNKIKDLEKLLQREKLFGLANEEKIAEELDGLLDYCAELKFDKIQSYIATTTNMLKSVGLSCLPHVLSKMFNNVEKCLSMDVGEDKTILGKIDKAELEKIFIKSQKKYKNKPFRLSKFKLSGKCKKARGALVAVKATINESQQIPIEEDEIEGEIRTRLFLLGIAKELSRRLQNPIEFYVMYGAFLDRLRIDNHFQLARDYAEEGLLIAIKNKVPHYGFLMLAKVYTSQNNIYEAVIYYLLLSNRILRSDKIEYEIKSRLSFNLLIFFRQFNFFERGISFYNEHLKGAVFDDYEAQQNHLAYINLLLLDQNESIIHETEEYLSTSKDHILNEGIGAVLPTYATLLNIQDLFKKEYSDSRVLTSVEAEFEQTLGSKLVGIIKDKTISGRAGTKDQLIQSLKMIGLSRYPADVINEINLVLGLASKTVETGVKKSDIEALLLAHAAYSDASLTVNSTTTEPDSRVRLLIIESDSPATRFDDYFTYIKKIISQHSVQFTWIGHCNKFLFDFSYYDGEFSEISTNTNFVDNNFRKWAANHLPNLGFEETRKINGQIYSFENYWEDDCEEIINGLPEYRLSPTDKEIVLFTDNVVSVFPHNLLLDTNNGFISEKVPITNPLSIDRLTDYDDISIDLSHINLWAPVEDGDIPINITYQGLVEAIDGYNVAISDQISPTFASNTDLKMVIAHGGRQADGHSGIFSSSNRAFVNPVQIFGEGKIAILFICHSGTFGPTFFSNECNSLIKTLLLSGYESVIAPFWSLNICIPKIWAPEFLAAFEENTIARAVYIANMAVKEKYKIPSAWAAMHLFGRHDLTTQ